MTDTNDIKPDALADLHAGAEVELNVLTTKLAAAGAEVNRGASEQAAIAAAQAQGNNGGVPNYADHALAAYQTGMAALLIAFARAHLPAKFQPAAEQAVLAVDDVLAGGPANNAQAVEHGVEAVVDAAQEAFQKPEAQA